MALSYFQKRFIVGISAIIVVAAGVSLTLLRDRPKGAGSGACVDASAQDLALGVQDHFRSRDYAGAEKALDSLIKCYAEDPIPPEVANRIGTEFELYGDYASFARLRLNCEKSKAANAHGNDPKALASRILAAIRKKDQAAIVSYFDCDGAAGELNDEFEPVPPEAVAQAFIMSTGEPKVASERESPGQYVMVLEGFEELGTVRVVLCERGGEWTWKYIVSGDAPSDLPEQPIEWCRKR